MFYSALQEGELIATGLNSTTRNDCINDVFDYSMTDSEEDEYFLEKMDVKDKENHLQILGYYIVDHAEPHPDPLDFED